MSGASRYSFRKRNDPAAIQAHEEPAAEGEEHEQAVEPTAKLLPPQRKDKVLRLLHRLPADLCHMILVLLPSRKLVELLSVNKAWNSFLSHLVTDSAWRIHCYRLGLPQNQEKPHGWGWPVSPRMMLVLLLDVRCSQCRTFQETPDFFLWRRWCRGCRGAGLERIDRPCDKDKLQLHPETYRCGLATPMTWNHLNRALKAGRWAAVSDLLTISDKLYELEDEDELARFRPGATAGVRQNGGGAMRAYIAMREELVVAVQEKSRVLFSLFDDYARDPDSSTIYGSDGRQPWAWEMLRLVQDAASYKNSDGPSRWDYECEQAELKRMRAKRRPGKVCRKLAAELAKQGVSSESTWQLGSVLGRLRLSSPQDDWDAATKRAVAHIRRKERQAARERKEREANQVRRKRKFAKKVAEFRRRREQARDEQQAEDARAEREAGEA
ncbi:hypothetical protein JCM10207_000344 [Rhodosporidiobolus poonsookiae]